VVVIVNLRTLGDVAIGTMRETERGFVTHSYAEGIADALGHGPRSNSRHRRHYLDSLGREAERLLADREAQVLVARDDGTGSLAYGFAVYRSPVVHWCYVKSAFRRSGIARELLELSVADGCTHFAYHSRRDDLMHKVGLSYLEPRGRVG
jgi:GNAT superfamily N-acetyltransferase